MPLYRYNGYLLRVSGSLASNENCCCGGDCCCYFGIAISGLTSEECASLSGIFTADTPCPSDGTCACDDVDNVICCVDGEVIEPYDDGGTEVGLTECECGKIGGTVVDSVEDCPGSDVWDDCSSENNNDIGTPGTTAGRICFPDGGCMDVDGGMSNYELCVLLAITGGIYESGVTCDDDPPCPNPFPDCTGDDCCCFSMTWSAGESIDYYSAYCSYLGACDPVYDYYLEFNQCFNSQVSCTYSNTITHSITGGTDSCGRFFNYLKTGTLQFPVACDRTDCEGLYVGIAKITGGNPNCTTPFYSYFTDNTPNNCSPGDCT